MQDRLEMKRWTMMFVAFVALTAGCTVPAPASCADGTCTDPDLPFCDVGGEVAGKSLTCIAVTCTPGAFAACRGDSELTCNSVGTDYDATQCEHGCDQGTGCRLCEPNQTVCTNGKAQTCDAAGVVTSSELCPLGCFEDQPRCRLINPSNNLAKYADMAVNAPDLDLIDPNFTTDIGTVTFGSESVAVPNFLTENTEN